MPTVTPDSAVIQVLGQQSTVSKGVSANFRLTPTVGGIVEDVLQQCGVPFDRYDVSAGTDSVDGWQLAERVAGIDAVDDLLRVFRYFLIEVDGKIKLVKRGGAVAATIADADLGAHLDGQENEPNTKTETERAQPLDLPTEVDLTYYSQASFYEQTNARAQRFTKPNQEKITVNTPIVMTEAFARQAAETILYDAWVARGQLKSLLPPKYLNLAPGDPINVTVGGVTARYRIIAMDVPFFGPITITAVLDDTAILTQTITGGTLPTHTAGTAIATATTMVAWVTTALRDVDAEANLPGFYVVVGPPSSGQDWPGAQLYISRDGGTTYQPLIPMEDPGDFGTTLTALPAGTTTGLFDEVTTVDIRMTSGVAPVSAPELEVLNGLNAAMVGNEMIQYRTVTALGGNDYRLSGLLRGRRATNNFWGTHIIGERFVILDNGGNSERVNLGEDLIGKTIQLKAVTNGQSITGVSPVSLVIAADELKPYDGADGQGARHVPAANDWTISWKRRTRCGGAWADLTDASLCELSEAYEAEIWSGGFTVLERTFTGLASSTVVYTEAQQIADQGSAQATVEVRVYQIGRTGRGFAYSFTVTG